MKILTAKQERYAQNLFSGMSQRDAYRNAYHATYSLATIDANASRLAHSAKILVRRQELNEKAESDLVMSVKERKERLSAIARAPLKGYYDPVRAIGELNKMEGEYAPEKHEVTTEVIHTVAFILPDGTIVKPKELSSGNDS